MTPIRRYASVLAAEGAARAMTFSLVGRLSVGMTGLAILLLVRESAGSFAAAGAVSGAYAVAVAVGSPRRARSADRSGPRRILLLCAVLHPAALAALTVLADRGSPPGLLAACAVLGGVTIPPLGAVMRAMWGRLVPPEALATAFSVEAVGIELCFVVGPTLTAALASVAGPSAALLASGGLALVGGLGLAASPVVRRVVPEIDVPVSRAGPLSSAAVRGLLLTVVWLGAGFGAVEVAMPAFAEAEGRDAAAAGLLLAVWALGSAFGGLVYGALRPTATPTRQIRLLVAALCVGAALPMLADGPVWMAVALFCYGTTIAPFNACNAMLLGRAAPPGTTTEAYAWSTSMIFAGFAIGSTLAGWLVEARGVTTTLSLTAVTALLALGSSVRSARRLA